MRVVRCENLDGSAGLYHVATEFLATGPAHAGSVRRVMRSDSSELSDWLTAPDQP